MIDREQEDKSRLKEAIQELQKEVNMSKEENFELFKKISGLEDMVQSKDTQIRRLTSNIELLKTDLSSLKAVKKSDKEKNMHRKTELAKGARILRSAIDSLPNFISELVRILKFAPKYSEGEFQSNLLQAATRFQFKDMLASLDAIQSADRSPSKPALQIFLYDEYWPLRSAFDSFSDFHHQAKESLVQAGTQQGSQEARDRQQTELNGSLDLAEDASLEIVLPADREDLLATAEAYLLLKQVGLGAQSKTEDSGIEIAVEVANSARCGDPCPQGVRPAGGLHQTRYSPEASSREGHGWIAGKAQES